MDQLEFRRVVGHFTTGVTVVASRTSDGDPCGLTANAVASVSLRPLLVLVCLDRHASSHGCILERGAFSINVLEEGDGWVADQFSDPVPEPGEKFEGIGHREETTGSPILDRALAWLDCRIWETMEAGDHTIVVGEVAAGDARPGSPLVFYRGRYEGLGE